MPAFFCMSLFGTAKIPPLMTELPPVRPIFSIKTTLLPFLADVTPAARAAKPEPMMTTSYSSSHLTSFSFIALAIKFVAPMPSAVAPIALNFTKSLLDKPEFFMLSPLK